MADSDINDSEVKEIPELTRRSRFNGTSILLSSFNQSPGLIDSTTNVTRDIRGEARIVERAFWLGAPALAEAAQFLNKRLQLEAA